MLPDYWRDTKFILRGEGDKCLKCGYVVSPHRKICCRCGGTEFETVSIPKDGIIHSCIVNYYSPKGLESPCPAAIVDLGSRKLYGVVTECDPEQVKVGMPVERVIRKLKSDNGYVYYGVRFRPKGE